MSYNKKVWANGDLITKERMNNIEDGIYDAHDKINTINNNVENNTNDTNTARQDISDIKLQIGTEELTTTSKKIKGAINELGSQINDKVSKQELEVERERINLLTKVENGQTEGNTELLDIRIGTDGTEYNTAGDSVRSQFNKVFSTNIIKEDINNASLWKQGGINSNGVGDYDTPYALRTNTYITGFNSIELTSTDYVVGIALYNQDYTNKKWIRNDGYFSSTSKYLTQSELESIDIFSLIEQHNNEYFNIRFMLKKPDDSRIVPSEYIALKITKNQKPIQMQLNETFQSVSNGKTLIASAITDKGINTSNTDTFQTMADNIAQIEQGVTGDTLLYKFGVVSDNHCATAYNAQNKMVKVLNYYNNSDVEFVCSCGDITTDKIENLDWLKNKMTELNFSKPFYAVRGNHDVHLTNEQWKSYLGQEPNFTFNKGNDMFIFLSIDNNTSNPYKYDNAWPYLQTLDVANKRVFLIQHLSWEGKAGEIDGAVRGFTKDNAVGNNIYNYFPSNLIAFTGHTHYVFECEEQIPQYDINVYNENRLSKTVIHCPSTGYAMDKDRNILSDIVQGWICEVYNKKIVLRAIDFNAGEYIADYVYTINTLGYTSTEPSEPSGPDTPINTDDEYNIYKFDTTKTAGDMAVTLVANRRGDTTEWDGVTDWGDGTTDTSLTHTYATDGVYLVKTKHDMDHSSSYKNNTRLKLIDCTHINKNMTDLSDFFNYCSNVVEFTNSANWDTSKVTTIHCTFMKCRGLTKLDTSGWVTDNMTALDNSFNGCNKLTTLDLSSWNTSNVTRVDAMFRGCSALTTLNLSSWNTVSLTNAKEMFYACSKLASLDISNFNMDAVTDSANMFYNCSALKQAGLTMTNCNEATKTKINSMVTT